MIFAWWIDEKRLKACGNPSDEDLAQLRSHGFSVGISLLDESSSHRTTTSSQPSLPSGRYTPFPFPKHAPSIEQIHQFMARLTESPEGTKIVVFCESGQGRTACMGAAYWIAQGLQAHAAIERMSKRCLDSEWPTPERRRILEEYERIRSRAF
jgi:protein-tyrosine phosphatase